MQIVRVAVLIVLAGIGLLTLIVGLAAPLYEAQFNERRERFLREGRPVTETVLSKIVGRRGKYLVVGAAGTPPPAAGERPDGRWIKVSLTTFEQYRQGDRIDLLVIGEEHFVRDAEFYTALTPTAAIVYFAVTGVLFVLVRRLWKTEPTPSEPEV